MSSVINVVFLLELAFAFILVNHFPFKSDIQFSKHGDAPPFCTDVGLGPCFSLCVVRRFFLSLVG